MGRLYETTRAGRRLVIWSVGFGIITCVVFAVLVAYEHELSYGATIVLWNALVWSGTGSALSAAFATIPSRWPPSKSHR